MTDEKIIQEIISGNEILFKELVKRYESRVAATVVGMLGNCPEADDVGQDTFIRFYNGLGKFRGASSVSTYLTRIAINLSLNELKRRKRKNFFFQKTEDDILQIPDKNNNQFNDEKEMVQHAILQLESKFKSVIVLRLIDGYSTAETAEILSIPTGTVLSRLARAQKKLKEILSPLMGGYDG